MTTIYSMAWDTSHVTNSNNMFYDCTRLSSKSAYGVVTSFDKTRIDKNMATSDNGYFTVPGYMERIGNIRM